MLPSYSRLSKSVLVIGQTDYLLRPVANLLDRAGFDISVVYRESSLPIFSPVNRLHLAKDDEALLRDIESMLDHHFDLIVLTDDLSIAKILHSHLSDQIKHQILPVTSKSYWGHLCSKNELSSYLKKSNVLQPPFLVSQSKQELEKDALALGFPLLLKIDFSGGGTGVFDCANLEQVRTAKLPDDCFPLLLQKKILGPVIDLSGFFYQGQVIHFSYAKFLDFQKSTFQPSIVRLYSTRQSIDPKIKGELNELGRALGLHGFVNISCILSADDGRRYYFEADVRPNAWVNFPYYLNDDPAKAINHFFKTKEVFSAKEASDKSGINDLQIPYIFRLSFLEIASNKYRVWKYTQEYSLSEIGIYFVGLVHSQILRWKLSALRMLQVLKQRLYHRPVYLMEATLIKYVIPMLPNSIAIRLSDFYKKIRALRFSPKGNAHDKPRERINDSFK